MNNYRLHFLKECLKYCPTIRIQDFERTKFKNSDSKDLSHLFLGEILSCPKKTYSTLINHNELLRYTIENDNVTEIKADLDFNYFEDNNHNIIINIELGRILYNKLKSIGIEPQVYYSGGKGVHINFLLSIQNLNFKTKINHLNHNNFDKVVFDNANKERQEFKKLFWNWLDIEKEFQEYLYNNNISYDKNILDLGNMNSSKTMLTLEGAKKRKEGARYKTKINYNYNTNNIILYLKTLSKPFIDTKFFFSNILKLSNAQIEEILKGVRGKDIKNSNSNINSNIISKKESKNNIIDNIILEKETEKINLIISLVKLKDYKNITSKDNKFNTYKFFCASVIKYYVPNDEEFKKMLHIFSKISKLEINYNNIIESLNNFQRNKFNFHNKYLGINKEDFLKCYGGEI